MNIINHVKGLIEAKNPRGLEQFFVGIPKAVLDLKEMKSLAQAKTPQEDTILMLTARYGLVHMAKAMMYLGADINHKNILGISPLMVASHCGNLQTVNFFIDNGSRINDKNRDGLTALMVAASSGNTAVVDALVKAGANIDIKDNSQKTALQLAAERGHKEVVSILKLKLKDTLNQKMISSPKQAKRIREENFDI